MMHYKIVKQVICDLKGDACGEMLAWNQLATPNCGICEYFNKYMELKE